MKSQAFHEYGGPLTETDAETPTPTGTEVLVRITHCGVCHSDIHIHDGYFGLGGDKKLDVTRGRELPFTLGHEIQGVVESAGPDAALDEIGVGSSCVVYPWIGCSSCPVCDRGEEHLCDRPHQFGINVDGGFASHVIVPHPRYLLDFAGVPDGLAATYMCSGLTAYAALKKLGHVGAGETVAIVGLGGVGMMGLQFARAMFPEAKVIGADIDPAKLDAAKAAGADAVYNTTDEGVVKTVLKETNRSIAGAIDFVGAEPSLAFSTGVIRKGGDVVIVGLMGGAYATPIPMFPLRSFGVKGTFVGSLADTREMMELVKAGKIDPIPLDRRPMDQAGASLDDLRAGRVLGRIVLEA